MQFKMSKYILPSIIAMVVVGTNTNIDGFFIGNIMGDDGLAAINIVWPIVACIMSVGTGIGIAGSVLFNEKRGGGSFVAAEGIKNATLTLLLSAGLILSILFPLVSKTLLMWMGAKGAVLEYAEAYVKIIGVGALFQISEAGVLVLLRNCGKTYQAMTYSILGLAVHFLLDMLLANRFQMKGVAAATVISQMMISLMGILSLKIDKNVKPDFRSIPQMLKGMSAPFGLNFVPSLVLLFTNHFALRYGGVAAVSAYAVMSYAVYTFDYIFQGVCDGIQPIISYCVGSGDERSKIRALKNAALLLFLFSILFCGFTPVLIRIMPGIFAVSEEAEKIMRTGFVLYAASYPCKATVKYICSYYYSAGKTKRSNVLVYLDPLLLTPGFLFILSAIMGLDGVWLAMTAAQLVLTLIGVIVFKRDFAFDRMS